MKYFFILFLLISSSFAAVTFNFQVKKTSVLYEVSHDEKGLRGVSSDHKIFIANEKCSRESLLAFEKNISSKLKQSMSLKKDGTLTAELNNQRKKIHSNSPLGKYLKNFTQHLLTLEKEVQISCSK